MICENISVSSEGHLLFAGQDTVELAKKYGTPLYLMDEDRIRANCRLYKKAMKESFGDTNGFTHDRSPFQFLPDPLTRGQHPRG